MAQFNNLIVTGDSRFLNTINGNITSANGIHRATMDSSSTATAFVLSADGISSLYDGLIITCKNTKVTSAANCTINLNGLGAKRIWVSQGNGYCTTHWAANQSYIFIYDGANERWELQQGRDTDNDMNAANIRWYNNVLAKTALTAEKLIGGNSSGYNVLTSGTVFSLVYPLLWTTAAVSAGSTNYSNMYLAIYDRNLTNVKSGFSGTANSAVYLVCTVSGCDATVDSTILTCTLPSTDDGKVYIFLGKLGSQSTGANYFYFAPEHPMFCTRGGVKMPYFPKDYAVDRELDSAVNLNNIKTPGFYNCGGNNTASNKPSGINAFGLQVIHTAGGEYYTQLCYPNSSTIIYKRICDNGTWGSWANINTTYTAATTAPPAIASAGAVGTSTNYARQDHTHAITVDTGDSDGQVKIAGQNASVKGLGTAAYKNVSTGTTAAASEVVMGNDTRLTNARPASDVVHTYSSTSTAPISGKGVAAALATLPDAMVFKGSLGTNGTITALPVDGSATIGDTYKVITDGTYADIEAKVGDTFICQTKTSSANTWVLIPSGDEPSGTVTSVAIANGGGLSIISGSPITSSGTITISHSNSCTTGTYRSVKVDAYGHVTEGTNPTTLAGYGITDAKIESGKITLGSNNITPLTASSTLDATKLSGTISTACYSNNRRTFYGTCSTGAATAAKVVTLSDTTGWELKAGVIVGVKFTETNTSNNVTLNINSTGAKSIIYGSSVYTSNLQVVTGSAGRITYYMYDGTNWSWLAINFAAVAQNTIVTNGNYPVLLSSGTDDNSDIWVARKSTLKFDTSTGNLQATQLNGVTIGSSPKFTDNDTKNTAGSTDTSSKIFLIGATSQAANPQTYSDDQVHVTSGALQARVLSATGGVNANTANSGAAGGVSLYSTDPATYGITMRNTGTSSGQLGKFGYVQGDWAGYLCFSGDTNRGYIFRHAATNKASISGEGHIVTVGSVTVGGNAANTSGCRMQYNSSLDCMSFVFP